MKDAAPRPTTIGMRARAMAVSIRRRHARDEGAARHPEMLLARIPVATLQVAYSASHIHWAPRIALTFASAGGSPRVVSPTRGHGAAAESRRLRVDHLWSGVEARALHGGFRRKALVEDAGDDTQERGPETRSPGCATRERQAVSVERE